MITTFSIAYLTHTHTLTQTQTQTYAELHSQNTNRHTPTHTLLDTAVDWRACRFTCRSGRRSPVEQRGDDWAGVEKNFLHALLLPNIRNREVTYPLLYSENKKSC